MFAIWADPKFCSMAKSEPFPTLQTFHDPWKKVFCNTVGKGENAGQQHFLLFPQCLHRSSKERFHHVSHL